eukprot:1120490-Amphidinium_carterae.1
MTALGLNGIESSLESCPWVEGPSRCVAWPFFGQVHSGAVATSFVSCEVQMSWPSGSHIALHDCSLVQDFTNELMAITPFRHKSYIESRKES